MFAQVPFCLLFSGPWEALASVPVVSFTWFLQSSVSRAAPVRTCPAVARIRARSPARARLPVAAVALTGRCGGAAHLLLQFQLFTRFPSGETVGDVSSSMPLRLVFWTSSTLRPLSQEGRAGPGPPWPRVLLLGSVAASQTAPEPPAPARKPQLPRPLLCGEDGGWAGGGVEEDAGHRRRYESFPAEDVSRACRALGPGTPRRTEWTDRCPPSAGPPVGCLVTHTVMAWASKQGAEWA